jgi:hypothetical protein
MPSKKTKATSEIAVEPPAENAAVVGTEESKEAALDKPTSPTSPTEAKKRSGEGNAFKAEELGTLYLSGL